jgi:hypothetical protein
MADYNRLEITTKICELISNGMSLRKACALDGMPAKKNFLQWMNEDNGLSNQYARAMLTRADHLFEEILDIADSQEDDVIILDDGREVTNHDVINRARLRVDTRKWMAGKLAPKKYGDKLDLDVGNKDGVPFMIATGVPRDGEGN